MPFITIHIYSLNTTYRTWQSSNFEGYNINIAYYCYALFLFLSFFSLFLCLLEVSSNNLSFLSFSEKDVPEVFLGNPQSEKSDVWSAEKTQLAEQL